MTATHLDAPGAQDAACLTTGTPYTPGMTESDCRIGFTRSSANEPVKSGQTLPTSTLTATAVWEAEWTSSVDPTPRELEVQDVTTTAEVPVGEIQSAVTG
ncbi:hypothetical protein KKR89_16445 [Cellulomonas dongxiuzhuiae]|uniref:Uncharacterized protein n=1 Tax=Cellulomonas dongxiuzhuiae TaxID=2819979 RepID=A0ABX8GP88_9CELL|nr:hypothetical protein [Cellulomonas dongxiuzhuiae]QWC18038.1 hypothetical protein KKR89_16445 [Cellulomonas dongxiuzhuiae]